MKRITSLAAILILYSASLPSCIEDLPLISDKIEDIPTSNMEFPEISTDSPATHITSYSAKIKGEIKKVVNNKIITKYGHCISTNAVPTLENAVDSSNFGSTLTTLTFESNCNSLRPNTEYFIRAYVCIEDSTIYSSVVPFSTGKECELNMIGSLPNISPPLFSFSVNRRFFVGGRSPDRNSFQLFEFVGGNELWVTKKELVETFDLFSYFSIGRYGVLGTGINESLEFLNKFWRYDTNSDMWSSIPIDNRISPRTNAFALSGENIAFMGGGFSDEREHLRDFWSFSAQFSTWSLVDNIPDEGRIETAHFRMKDTFYVIGGSRNDSIINTGYKFNFKESSFSESIEIPGQIGRRNGIGFSIANKGFIGFGTNLMNSGNLSDLQMFDPKGGIWEKKTNFPFRGDATTITQFIQMDTLYLSVSQKGTVGGLLYYFVP